MRIAKGSERRLDRAGGLIRVLGLGDRGDR